MADNNDMPRTHTIKPMDPPPDSAEPTTAMLKGDVDSGRTRDKVPVFDPGMSPLGTDDEVAGRPPSAFRIALARFHETKARWVGGPRTVAAARDKPDAALSGFIGFIGAVAVVFIVGIWAF
jgi:hypothetical protein